MKNMNMGIVVAVYVLVSLFFSATAHAKAPSPDYKEGGKVNCQQVANLAHYVMLQRQTSNDMPAMMKEYKSSRVVQNMIKAAFSENYYFTQDMKQYEIKDFTNSAYQGCLDLPDYERNP